MEETLIQCVHNDKIFTRFQCSIGLTIWLNYCKLNIKTFNNIFLMFLDLIGLLFTNVENVTVDSAGDFF